MVEQVHVRFLHSATTLAVIAGGAGGYHVRPDVLAAQMAGKNMVYRQSVIAFTAILAGIIVASKYLTPRQLDARPRTVDLHSQPNDRRARN